MAASRPTMADVAAEAGVSIPTVSKVLNGRADVSETTRSKVFDAMANTGYRGRSPLGRERTGIIEILIDGINSPWAVEIISGAQQAAARNDCALVITTTQNEIFSVTKWLAGIGSRRSDGVIFVSSPADRDELAALTELHTAVVLLDPIGTIEPAMATVGATNWAGGLAATEHLISLGHRDIGFIGGPAGTQSSRERFEGYTAALRRHGIEPDDRLIANGDYMTEGGRTGGLRLLTSDHKPTAIFAGSDLQAAGVYQAAQELGRRIPDDLSVIGFDDTMLCEYLSPPLTTMRQPLEEMAAEAVRLVLDIQSDRPHSAHRRIELATSLIVRNSTATPAR